MNPNSADQNNHEYWMAQAIALAQKGQYTTSPNPNVGCVIVNAGNLCVGKGAHMKAGDPHAEVHALKDAGKKAKGATAYVTLEPCSHTGKTPPCADALVKAGVACVVIANNDPNPNVNGNGIRRLEEAGIKVITGVLRDQAKQLNLGFLKRMATGMPYVRVKLAASLDGKTALENGESQWITGPCARRDVQHLRSKSCAILTGSGTVRDDNPSLLVRPEQAQFEDYPEQAIRQPLRVVVEGNTPLSPSAQLFNDGEATLLVTCNNEAQRGFSDSVSVHHDTNDNAYPCLKSTLAYLAKQECNSVLVEAGATLAGAFIAEGLVDELVVYLAPMVIGHSGAPLVTLPHYEVLAETPKLQLKENQQIGEDIRLTYVFED
ncbi:bifunctional diaminohydroxyphosphoribosylaminopyrimidine deaminase/5-amino-6-(5-phosphoribosylamino)uracil reductase RibD [Alteromonas sp. 5E99-2]|uniref:bifunctional diaminohydroxyphosphoribosylaminopyrimidine deaminase/5-amino-6-(5-phosphoribosylamino)uracil reductase RibD n=1 Tax=Alteromonas sp. 5E99-2 TaxID=2817683 RepID=UPI001A9835FB|nr:bifunctional diaminohydroxyphosphoribosylaminopyrimidine deaminase/5-amino-6-(5-phosphoribosylamino)uracil reductase RibD [Alteromonas sp. 5E99-2]MBO1255288.1 bifunctional diaminohydroxyphosphoribosylaminopyrimidine deaminase/5-amino-6-(5-phosphoribosylamino)uracil reductase RibD [Alteromonas sp. 5E99-2]